MATRIGVRLGTVSLPAMMVASQAVLTGPAAAVAYDFQTAASLPTNFGLSRTTISTSIDNQGRRTFGPNNHMITAQFYAGNSGADGTIVGDKFIPSAIESTHSLGLQANRAHQHCCLSIELKADGYDKFVLTMEDLGSFARYKINLANGT